MKSPQLSLFARGTVGVFAVVIVASAAAGCSRSTSGMTTASVPAQVAPAPVTQTAPATQTGAVAAGTSSDLGAPAPIALVPETGAAPVTASQVTVGDAENGDERQKPMTAEERARVIAELEALAQQQADF